VFEVLLTAGIHVANAGITASAPRVLSLVHFGFRVLEALMNGDLEGTSRPALEEVAGRLGKTFRFAEAAAVNQRLAAAVFPVLYKSGMRPMMECFFGKPGASELPSAFGAAYVKALRRLDVEALVALINGGLVERTLQAISVPEEHHSIGKPEFVLPRSVFVLQLAELLCTEELLQFDARKLTQAVRNAMNSDKWFKMASLVIQSREFTAREIARASQDSPHG
jgi:hypothetical protein